MPACHLKSHHSTTITLGPPSSLNVTSLVNAAKMIHQQQFSQKVADDLLLLWIIHANIPFSVTLDYWYQALFQYLNDRNQIPRSPTTIKQRILNHFHLFQPCIAELMQQAVTHIHLACDGWTSPHQTMVVLGIIAHFTSQVGTRMNPVIGPCSLEGSYTGSNITGVVSKLLQEYGVQERLGYFIGDTASNNDTLVRALADEQVFGKRNYNAQEHRLRSVGHVINLVVTAFWFAEVDQMTLQDTVIATQDTIAECRKMGPRGKGHNITTYRLASPPRQQEFKRLGGETILHRDNATHWNTGYSMIQSLIRNRDVVDVFCLHHSEQLEEDRLSLDDWEQLADTVNILQPFHSATLCIEGDFSEPHNVLVGLEFLQATFTRVLQKYQANPHQYIHRAAAGGIVVLDKYQEFDKELTVCVAAGVLHPAYKWEYFEVAVDKLEWTDDQLLDAKLRVQGLWVTKYMPLSSLRGIEGVRQPDTPPSPVTPFAPWQAHRQRTVISNSTLN